MAAKQKATNKEYVTDSNIPVKRVYLKSPKKSNKEEPGKYPFTRGIHPTLHRSKLWTMRMFAGFGTAEETNQRFKLYNLF